MLSSWSDIGRLHGLGHGLQERVASTPRLCPQVFASAGGRQVAVGRVLARSHRCVRCRRHPGPRKQVGFDFSVRDEHTLNSSR